MSQPTTPSSATAAAEVKPETVAEDSSEAIPIEANGLALPLEEADVSVSTKQVKAPFLASPRHELILSHLHGDGDESDQAENADAVEPEGSGPMDSDSEPLTKEETAVTLTVEEFLAGDKKTIDQGPAAPQIERSRHMEGLSDESEEDEEDAEMMELRRTDGIFPKHVVKFEAFDKESKITAIEVPLRGHRIIVGDSRAVIRVWDFHDMDVSGSRYREHVLTESHPIQFLRFSESGTHMITSTQGENFLRVLDSQLDEVITTYRGDMYVRDAAQTHGHTHDIRDALWVPNEPERFATGSLDGTVRVFDIKSAPQGLDQALPSLCVFKTSDRRGATITRECGIHSLAWLGDKLIAAACEDDSIQFWDSRIQPALKSKKNKMVARGHHGGSPVLKLLAPSISGNKLISSSGDKLLHFDSRNFRQPVKSVSIPWRVGGAVLPQLSILEAGKYILSTAWDESAEADCLWVLDGETLEKVEVLETSSKHITALHYHQGLRQVFCGGDEGKVSCLFSVATSQRGEGALAIKQSARQKKTKAEDALGSEHAFSWYDLPSNVKAMPDDSIREIRRKRHQLRREANPTIPSSHRLPHEEPVLKQTMAQTVMKQFLDSERKAHGEDRDVGNTEWIERMRRGESKGAREYGELTGVVTGAYRRTQPVPVFDRDTEMHRSEAALIGGQKCPQCGLKMCTCGYMDIINRAPATKKARQG